MADLEQEEVIDETTDVVEENNEETQETQEENNNYQEEVITWEQAQEWKAKAERLDKAEKKLVEQKKALKEVKQTQKSDIDPKETFKRLLAEEKFYDKNPEAESYRDKIEKYQEKGLSLEEAYTLASKFDQNIENNREVYGKSIVRGNQSSSEGVKLVSVGEYDRMTASEQDKYNSDHKAKYGVVKFK